MSIVVYIPKRILNKYSNTDFYAYSQTWWKPRFVSYIINSDYRKAVHLVPWINKQVLQKEKQAWIQTQKKRITTKYKNHDSIAIECLKTVKGFVTYTGDTTMWKMLEHWNEYHQTIMLKRGDCEDGAILLFVLMLECGIPSNRMLIFAGNVVGGGHAWLGYMPTEYPSEWVFLDWCYWYTNGGVGKRPHYFIAGKKIGQVRYFDKSRNNYTNMWFGFNNKQSFTDLQIPERVEH